MPVSIWPPHQYLGAAGTHLAATPDAMTVLASISLVSWWVSRLVGLLVEQLVVRFVGQVVVRTVVRAFEQMAKCADSRLVGQSRPQAFAEEPQNPSS